MWMLGKGVAVVDAGWKLVYLYPIVHGQAGG